MHFDDCLVRRIKELEERVRILETRAGHACRCDKRSEALLVEVGNNPNQATTLSHGHITIATTTTKNAK